MRKNTLYLACALASAFLVNLASAESLEERLGLTKGSVVSSSTTVTSGKVMDNGVNPEKVYLDGKAQPMVEQEPMVKPTPRDPMVELPENSKGYGSHGSNSSHKEEMMHNCNQYAYRDHNSFTFQFALAGNVRYYQLESFTKNGKTYGRAEADEQGEEVDYFAAFGRLNFSAYYNLYNSPLFKVALGPDLFINAGALGQKPNILHGRVRAQDIIKPYTKLINFGLSAFFQVKSEYIKPYLKFTASRESYSDLGATASIYTGTLGLEFKNGFTLYLSGQTSNMKAERLFSEGRVDKSLKGFGAEFGIGTYF